MTAVLVVICVVGYALIVMGIVTLFGCAPDLGDRMWAAAVRRYDEMGWTRDEKRAFEKFCPRCPDFVPPEWEKNRHG